jgi:hypothetical protein
LFGGETSVAKAFNCYVKSRTFGELRGRGGQWMTKFFWLRNFDVEKNSFEITIFRQKAGKTLS